MELSGDGWSGDFGGNAPVQGEGEINGRPFYFRARGKTWEVLIAYVGDDPLNLYIGGGGGGYTHVEDWPGDDYAAGWMTMDEVRVCMERAVSEFRQAGRP